MNELDKATWLHKVRAANARRTPYMLTDLTIIERQCEVFKSKFPRVKFFYAIKAFSDNEVIRVIDPMADGYDAASIPEIRQLLALKISADRIAFSNPVKPEEDIADAFRLGVQKFAFQSLEELEKLARQAPGAAVYVRVKVDDHHSTVRLSVKYGCPSDAAVSLLLRAKELGLDPIGVNFHIGSQQTGLDVWHKAIEKSREIIKQARSKGMDTYLINIGGGLPVQYQESDPEIGVVADTINSCLDKAEEEIEFMAEPGRFIVADSSAIVSSVIGAEERGGKHWLYLDVGLFQAFISAQRFEPFPHTPVSLRHLGEGADSTNLTKKYVLTGPSCDSHDIITHEVELPADLKIGDTLLFPKTGAYNVAYGSGFNGFAVPPRHYIRSTGEK